MKRRRNFRNDAELVVAGVLILGVAVFTSVQLMRVNDPERPVMACTQIGCRSGLSLSVERITSPEVRAVEVCFDTTCQQRSRREVNSRSKSGLNDFFFEIEDGESDQQRLTTVSVRELDANQRTVKFDSQIGWTKSIWLNGRSCPPPCQQLAARYERGELTLDSPQS